ncbi:MGMT family protein [Marinobacter orientalis]|uniref:Cysteine methyltransferase n=1 Tax=Marinobacter orientalis TaxID=1928859 RepID=A0A7Y0WTF0_9GAMM|nr:MGMT family protein [Marinobacter orientalis]NMT64766.1 cysteine methyltransferase [Marinobacter orientalis]TGX48202.1 cysteine methyltransferase [Marinobacter orientalis]
MTEPTKDQKIWQVVAAIPAGRVASYGQVAHMAGLGRQARYIGRALGKLPEGHAIPWYRVIRSDGRIAFPIGSEAFEVQARSLREEGVEVVNGRVAMRRYGWNPSVPG